MPKVVYPGRFIYAPIVPILAIYQGAEFNVIVYYIYYYVLLWLALIS